MVSVIKIVTSSGRQIDYSKPEDLSIKLNRVADDLQDIEARYGEFSYTFSLPRTRNNEEIFGFAGVPHVRNIFKINPVDIQVFNNDTLLLTGQLELQEVTDKTYKCVFYSKLTQLVDLLKDKNMQDVISCPKIEWNYEVTIRAHINSGFTSCDETSYQFPLIYYNTYHTPTSIFSGLTDTIVDSDGTTNHVFQRERAWQNWYYLINRTGLGQNEMYFHQIPLAFYLKSMIEFMLQDIGWSVGGSFWENENIKKIIVPFVGDTDVYDRATYCSNGSAIISGGTCSGSTLMLDTSRFMPKVSCLDFLQDIVKLFNLYMLLDINNQIIIFESYDVMFGSKTSPYSINEKVIGDARVNSVDDYNPSIRFADIENKRILGDNRYIASTGTSAYSIEYLITGNNTLFDEVYNHNGTTKGEIKLNLGAPAVKRMRIRNDYDFDDVNRSAGDSVMFLPFISKQLPEDNGGKPFSKDDNHSTVFNDESSIQYNGKPALYYYYGVSTSDFLQKTELINKQSNYFYFNFYSTTNQKIPFASPFALLSFRDVVDNTINDAGLNPTGSTDDSAVMLASYMQSIYLMMASTTGVTNTTDFSLILSDNSDYGDTIYTKFHSQKYKRYRESEVLTVNIMMTDVEWNILQINQPVLYNNQIYSILQINNYDVIKQVAEIKLIKQI